MRESKRKRVFELNLCSLTGKKVQQCCALVRLVLAFLQHCSRSLEVFLTDESKCEKRKKGELIKKLSQ